MYNRNLFNRNDSSYTFIGIATAAHRIQCQLFYQFYQINLKCIERPRILSQHEDPSLQIIRNLNFADYTNF